ncbi:hypothetical protein ElyMa_001142800 [Elysia marginata]|uniref:Uncharacterized protein n=1 Tax=Elysia marginata TaxID=1093978 RepID=A0AAV4I105_9GAST|nr:hypothetical protein ElyMa_001142800 [Elysia marginata]
MRQPLVAFRSAHPMFLFNFGVENAHGIGDKGAGLEGPGQLFASSVTGWLLEVDGPGRREADVPGTGETETSESPAKGAGGSEVDGPAGAGPRMLTTCWGLGSWGWATS